MASQRVMLLIGAGALLAACSSAPPGPGSSTPTPATPSASATESTEACPSGSTSNQPGDPAQARPALRDWYLLAALDPTAGRVIAGETGIVPEGAGQPSLQATWAFDLCLNTWVDLPDESLPAAADRPAIGQYVSDPAADVVLGLPVGLAPVWQFEPGAESWSRADVTGGGSEDAWPMAVYDPEGDRLLAFDPNVIVAGEVNGTHASGVLAFDLVAREWTHLDAEDAKDSAKPMASMQQNAVAYDSAAHRLVLVVTSVPPDKAAKTWLFDPEARTWSRGADVPETLPNGYPGNWFALAFDPVTARTWAFGDTAMLGYDATADDWLVADRDAGWPDSMMIGDTEVDPMARSVRQIVVDPDNGRLIMIGGNVRRAGETPGGFAKESDWVATDDVWAYEPATNTWTMMLGPSGAPASYGPG